MESKAKILGHAVHPILIVFPLGLLATAVVFDIVHLINRNSAFSLVAYWMIVAGLIGGAAAAPFGWFDWFAIPTGTRAKRVGLMHGLTMATTLVLFFISWWLRPGDSRPPTTSAYVFSFGGAVLALIGSWFGGELVERLGIGVDNGAHADAPSSLSTEPVVSVDLPNIKT
jgi:uncharacterized membrane protein